MTPTDRSAAQGSSVFHGGGGHMGARVRAFDWAATPLGPIDSWPPVLRLTVDQVLGSKLPTCLFWGPGLHAVYNDGFHALLGRKPEALGQPMCETWQEIWPEVEPFALKALAGEATFVENFLLKLNRHGKLEDSWFTFNYGPVFDEQGRVVGMLDTALETTSEVLAARQRREERERYLDLLQQMPGFVSVLYGPTHLFRYVNEAFRQVAGPRDFIGRTVREAVPELEGQGFYEALDQVYRSGQPFQSNAVPIRLQREDGRRFIDLLFTPIRDGSGAVYGIFVGGHDVTERVKAEASLRDINADLERRVIERAMERGRTWQLSPELLGVANADGFFESVNPAWQRMLGWSEAELARAPAFDFIHPEDLERTRSVLADAFQDGVAALRFENRYRVKGGGWRWLSWVAVTEGDKIYCSARDIQEDKEAAETLARRTVERNVLASIVESTNTLIQVLDKNFRLLALNQAIADEYQRIYGRRPAVGDNLLEIFSGIPEHRAAAEALWWRAMAGESFVTQGEFGDPARTRRFYEMKFEPLRGEDGRQIGAFMAATDITERQKEHQALLDTQDALRQAQKMEAVGQLTGGIAHDFNNLLAGIGGSLQMMHKRLQAGQTDGLERYVEMSESSVRRASALTHRLLAFSRRQTLDPKPVDVSRLVGGMAEMIRRTVGPSVTLALKSAAQPWPTQVDPSQLENALLNLCINARDAMLPSGGRLSVSVDNHSFGDAQAAAHEMAPGDYVCLSVTDTGAGIATDVIGRIFDPFYTTKPLGQGTGLGLSMVYGFVRQSGGRVTVASSLGSGTTLSIYLPRFSGEPADETGAAAQDSLSSGQGETVLLIEDEDIVREVIHEVLCESGYRVLVAGDGPTGLHMLQADGRIDLLLTDVGLPGGMNGRQVADAARVVRPDLKVLFITGYAENAAVGNGAMERGMEVMTKPFEIEALSQRVRLMMDRPLPQRPARPPSAT